VGAVSIAEPLLLRVEVDREARPVSGRVASDDGALRAFAGWTELFAALQAAIADDEAKENRYVETS
jgi:hypothetical protein